MSESELKPSIPFMSKVKDYDPGFVPLPLIVYRESRIGMSKHLKALDMALRRAPVWETMKREDLVKRITKLRFVISDMRQLVQKAEGM